MKSTKKMIFNLLLFVLLMVIVLFIVFKNFDMKEALNVIKDSKKYYLLIAAITMSLYILCESSIIHILLEKFKHKKSIFKCIKYSNAGFFFSGITPSSTGGQPMQVYYMFKDGIPISCSSIVLLIVLTCYIIVNVSFAIFGLFYNSDIINSIGGIKYFVYFGLLINILALLVCLILTFSKNLSTKIINIFIKLLKLFKYKKIEEKEKSLSTGLINYHNSAKYFKNNKPLIIKILLITIIQLVGFYSVTYFVYKSFGLNEYSYLTIILLQSVLYTTTSILPLPGAIGANESGFLVLFKTLFATNLLASGMLLNRLINFYLYMLLSGLILLVCKVIESYRIKNNKNILFKSDKINYVNINKKYVNDYLTMVNDIDNVSRFILDEPKTFTIEEELEWIKTKLLKENIIFTMLEKDTNAFIGNIELIHTTSEDAELGISITKNMQDKHYGTESIKRIIDYAFNELNLNRLYLRVFSNNPKAIKCYENLGFVEYGERIEKKTNNEEKIFDIFMELKK